jgi:L-threonylcarbamoyladenylate synthase
LNEVAAVIKRGGVVAYPTEAVFGLGCDPLNENAVRRILQIKQREAKQGLLLIASSLAALEPWIDLAVLTNAARDRVLQSWPGPHTWVCPKSALVPPWISGAHDSVAVRVTAHPIAAALCELVGGPLVSTSANRSGSPPLRNACAVDDHLGTELDAVLIGDCGDLATPTTIRVAHSGQILRP